MGETSGAATGITGRGISITEVERQNITSKLSRIGMYRKYLCLDLNISLIFCPDRFRSKAVNNDRRATKGFNGIIKMLYSQWILANSNLCFKSG